MTVWHWVRHGPTHARSLVGWRDLPADLSDREQISRVRKALPEDAVLVSSDLVRARHTAGALRASAYQPITVDPHLREIHFGRWEGYDFQHISTRDPELSRRFWESPGDIMAPGGESWNQASARVAAAVRHISRRYPDRDVIAVAHFGVILTQLQRAWGRSAYETLAQPIDNLSITTIDLRGARPSVQRVNHLA